MCATPKSKASRVFFCDAQTLNVRESMKGRDIKAFVCSIPKREYELGGKFPRRRSGQRAAVVCFIARFLLR